MTNDGESGLVTIGLSDSYRAEGVRTVTEEIGNQRYPQPVSHVVELFHSPHCISCPEARALLRELAARRPDVIVIERDIEDAEALAQAREYHLIATPALVIDREKVLYGVPTLEKLTDRIATSAPAAS